MREPLQPYLCILMQPPRRGRAGVHFCPFLVVLLKMCLWIWVCPKRKVGLGASKSVRNTRKHCFCFARFFHREQELPALLNDDS